MRLNHLSLTNFRNFVRLETELAEGLTLVVGANAQGKTSLLESIYYLTGARSPHAANDRQLINFLGLQEASPFSRVMGEVSRGDRLHRIEIRILLEAAGPMGEKRTRKEIHINGLKRRVRDLAGGFNAVMFLPQDLRILEGSPGERRRYLDATISQADPLYAESLAEYAKVLSQRNALLKQLQEENGDEGQLTFWDE
nr:AAA family ATPase [Armatimonadota bacterium]